MLLKNVLIYALVIAAIVAAMRLLDYFFIVRQLSLEFYLGIVALCFAAAGVWIGIKFTGKSVAPKEEIQVIAGNYPLASAEELGISKRELEVLQLMAAGMSNQEIADKLFVSLNTIKTHSANLYTKLEVSRRTQAVVRARELGLIA